MRGSADFINLCVVRGQGVGGWRCPQELLAARQEKDDVGVFHIELGINGSDGVFRGDRVALLVCLQEPNY